MTSSHICDDVTMWKCKGKRRVTLQNDVILSDFRQTCRKICNLLVLDKNGETSVLLKQMSQFFQETYETELY